MKIHEIILETAEWIYMTFLLSNIDIKNRIVIAKALREQYNNSSDLRRKEQIASGIEWENDKINELLHHRIWAGFEDDPDYKLVYSELSELFDDNNKFLHCIGYK